VRKVLLKHAVHLGKVRHVVEEDIDFDDTFDSNTSLLQYAHNVLAALRRLVGDAALDQGACVVGGDLARDEDLGACDDGLGLWCVNYMQGIAPLFRGCLLNEEDFFIEGIRGTYVWSSSYNPIASVQFTSSSNTVRYSRGHAFLVKTFLISDMSRVCNWNIAGLMNWCVCRRDVAGRKSRMALRCMELLTAWGKRRLSPAYVADIGANKEGGGSDARSSGASGVRWRGSGEIFLGACRESRKKSRVHVLSQ
jgi:hypothetical protein